MTQTRPIQEPTLKLDELNSIYIPSLGLSIAKQAHLFGLDYHQQQKESNSIGVRFSTLYEQVEFLKHLWDNRNNLDYKKIFDYITKAEGCWRAENTDAYFEKDNKGQIYVLSHILSQDGQIKQLIEPLEDCLMEDRRIDIEHYLINHTSQGLPKKDIQKGNYFYYYPRDKSVARFVANSFWAGLNCGRHPGSSIGDFGVRAVGVGAKVH